VRSRFAFSEKVLTGVLPFVLIIVFSSTILTAQPPTDNNQQANSNQSPSKRPPQARTQQEYADYKTAYPISGGSAMEKAADDFAAKYPEIRSAHSTQRAGEPLTRGRG
jgi:hypothetical protein